MEISYQRGISELLGYSEQEFNHDLLSRFYHPDDFKRYFYLLKLSNKWARKLSPDPFSVETSIDYRIRKKDGSYVKVLRQSTVFQNCVNNKIMSAFSILTDISRIKTNTSINLSVIHRESGRVILEEIENSPDTIEFSKREKEILLKLKSGLGSKAIADELFISRHTVDTHRRKMLAKAKCKNVMELISCATMIGVI
ncbi:MAG: LuxR C-terminal-related transcriptional regulator [Bacteroidales bacterium]|nr:LuxR C-terminal-related transcriptional regulator [Bacteroidales bacterium]MCF8456436.1 LuxR C-terminal-related transcriptional regulator [Bacteroidales bacterium]